MYIATFTKEKQLGSFASLKLIIYSAPLNHNIHNAVDVGHITHAGGPKMFTQQITRT